MSGPSDLVGRLEQIGGSSSWNWNGAGAGVGDELATERGGIDVGIL